MKRLVLATLTTATLGLALTTGANALKPVEFSSLTNNITTENAVQLAGATGQFVTVDQAKATTGTADIVTENGQNYIVFSDAFSTATGPDVQVVLYNADEVPVSIDEADYTVLADLQSFEGGQEYLIPSNIDINDYEAVAIWCREFNVTFGYAPL
ncbi:DM13 domain-containing protein [Oscillatoria sp. CS-180]|uniref:DM13 domain-containing protein n=1 Tax=Oscillatoria sp. CS-180 TaxID=3021720 RepID=UPI0023300A49|nr:DM13 domain-containing protein [Oscillatoria sp. CS-180]MDB9529841.1 DM13 domain-containing protein [Oscillatoria sp. CS-180]